MKKFIWQALNIMNKTHFFLQKKKPLRQGSWGEVFPISVNQKKLQGMTNHILGLLRYQVRNMRNSIKLIFIINTYERKYYSYILGIKIISNNFQLLLYSGF